MSVSHTNIQIWCKDHTTHCHVQLDHPLWFQLPSGHWNPTRITSCSLRRSLRSREPYKLSGVQTAPRPQYFSGVCREDLPVPSVCNINHPVSPQATLGPALYPVKLGGTCLCPILCTHQDIHLKPNISSVSGSSDHNCNISTLKPSPTISSQVIDQSQSTSNPPSISKSGSNPHKCLRYQ